MKNRIRQIIDSEELSQSEFAQRIGVQRSNISHILSGRNKPSVDFLQKLLSQFTHLNIEWILSGVGSMYKVDATENKVDTNIKHTHPVDTDSKQISDIKEQTEDKNLKINYDDSSTNLTQNSTNIVLGQPDQVLVLFNDQTFVTYKKR